MVDGDLNRLLVRRLTTPLCGGFVRISSEVITTGEPTRNRFQGKFNVRLRLTKVNRWRPPRPV